MVELPARLNDVVGQARPNDEDFSIGRSGGADTHSGMKYYVYILRSKQDSRKYVGMTTDIDKRLYQHNAGRVRSTRTRRPLTLIYKEELSSLVDARKREKYFKTAAGRRFLKNIRAEMVELADTHV